MIKITAIIVTYNPNIENVENLCSTLTQQDAYVVVVDNGSTNLLELSAKLTNNKTCLLALNKNMGIAYAQNRGINKAIESRADYVLFFDQDSSISDCYIQDLIFDFEKVCNTLGKPIGIIGPRFVDKRYGFYYKAIKLDKNGFRTKIDLSQLTEPIPVSLVISSGSMIPVKVLQDVGFMEDKFFIDYVDTEWCFRALSKKYEIIVSTKAKMEHTIGDSILKIWKFNIPLHSPFRRYYRVRNAFFLLRMRHVPFLFAIRELCFNFIHQLILVFFVKNRVGYLKSWYKGIKDGILNKENI